ncbi:hypothetical protein SASC598O02_010050 [Snodgrassella alvi SCGC AB-598-O02]|nr:hypothetical protein SASC598O02_010050 [Snodgrassella alvi SCGC AB-598-O02]
MPNKNSTDQISAIFINNPYGILIHKSIDQNEYYRNRDDNTT